MNRDTIRSTLDRALLAQLPDLKPERIFDVSDKLTAELTATSRAREGATALRVLPFAASQLRRTLE